MGKGRCIMQLEHCFLMQYSLDTSVNQSTANIKYWTMRFKINTTKRTKEPLKVIKRTICSTKEPLGQIEKGKAKWLNTGCMYVEY